MFDGDPQDFIHDKIGELRSLWAQKRQLSTQGFNLAMIVFSALMIWKGLMVVTCSDSPVVVVLRYGSTLAGDVLASSHCRPPTAVVCQRSCQS